MDEAGEPDKQQDYGFCGRVRQEVNGNVIKSQPTFKSGLKYRGKKGSFYYFTAPKIISDADDYRGSSGAPVIEESGKLIGLAAKVWEGTQLIYVFPIERCKELVDTAILTKML